MTPDVLKELVEQLEKNPGDMLEALRDHEQFKALELIKALRKAEPTLKSLLSQEAELRELEGKMRAKGDRYLQQGLIYQGADWIAFADELSALIRRHHES